MSSFKNDPVIQRFVKYLQIPSVHPNIDYDPCLEFLISQADEIGLPYQVLYMAPKKPIVVMTWEGTHSELSSCMLVSHMDVVPVFEDSWKYHPFSAHIDKDGKIFARGSQDMKSVAMQYLEAIRRLKNQNVTLKRTIHLCFTPDEEIGGVDGMMKFVKSKEFKALNIGMSLDEGMASATDDYLLFYGERTIWQLIVKCKGTSGHGSLLLDNTAGEKARIILDRFIDFRNTEKEKLKNNPSMTIGDVTTVNLTKMRGGVQCNVVPEIMELFFDIRIAVDVDMKELEKTFVGWCEEAGDGVEIEFEKKFDFVEPTKLDNSNPFWNSFRKAADELKITVLPRIFPGGTDSFYIREVGIPSFGFSPMNNTPVLLHSHNEYLHVDVFRRGIEIYEKLIFTIAQT